MALHDAELIQRTLRRRIRIRFSGGQVQRICPRLSLPQARRFPHRRRNHAGHLPQGVPETIDAQRSGTLPRLAVCDCRAMLHLLVSTKSPTN